MTDPAHIARLAEGLTKTQRDMMTRPNGRYQDSGVDILALLNLELIGTVHLPLGSAVRAHLTAAQEKK